MKKILFVLLCIAGITGCSQYGRSKFLYKDADGADLYNIRCKSDIADCYKGAGKSCSSGFEIIDWHPYKSYGPVSVAANRRDKEVTEQVIKGNGKFMTGGGTMLFKCKK